MMSSRFQTHDARLSHLRVATVSDVTEVHKGDGASYQSTGRGELPGLCEAGRRTGDFQHPHAVADPKQNHRQSRRRSNAKWREQPRGGHSG